MLQLRNIKKDYKVGDSTVAALKGVSLSFRRNEFVSILGASGCGKTTLLNIIGGLDHYTSGDLIIEGISTKDYKDGDWDTYRNHRIGFVFQTYNLIPHQTVLSNVELALTLSGVSPKERKARATEALRRVGLESELNKKPNQLSGGQMQRVAIARALVNNPEILLADEPTGALDTNTSVQIMDLIKEIAGERLVIMVTHNPELAYKYSSRIVELKDGLVVSDSAPYSREEEEEEVARHKAAVDEQTAVEPGKKDDKAVSRAAVYKKKHSSMSLLTAFALSGKNLLTKKTRTFITSIAGSIGIISVCLVLALSSGFNSYIRQTEEDMLSYYPVEVSETAFDSDTIMSVISGGGDLPDLSEIEDQVYINSFLTQVAQGMTVQNDINEEYLAYLEAMDPEIVNAIQYSYGVQISTNLVKSVEIGSDITHIPVRNVKYSLTNIRNYYTYALTAFGQQYAELAQLVDYLGDVVSVMPGTAQSNYGTDSWGSFVRSQYDVVAGSFPTDSDQAVLVVGSSNDITDLTLAQLGLLSESEFLSLFENGGENSEIPPITFEDIVGDEKTGKEGVKYYLYYNDEVYVNGSDSSGNSKFFYNGDKTSASDEISPDEGVEIEVVGVLRLKEGLTYGCLSSGLNLTGKLITEYISRNMQSEVVQAITNGTDGADFSSLDYSSVPYVTTLSYSNNKAAIRAIGGNDSVYSISIYPRDFDTKGEVLAYLDEWNETHEKSEQITYTDTVGTLMSMVDTILDAITYVLIAFTAISLVVSTVMIGVITYVSVVERTKEIGILRSIGARKRDIRHVFNAETFIIGLFAGLIGVIVAYLLQLLINLILTPLTGISGLAALPIWQAAIMLCVSIVLTLISGLIPASSAANKDPVIALRTE